MAQATNNHRASLRSPIDAESEDHRLDTTVVTIPLESLPILHGIRFESMDVMVRPRVPLARVRCKNESYSQEIVLRVDLDKEAFIDPPFGVGQEGDEQKVIKQITEVLAPYFRFGGLASEASPSLEGEKLIAQTHGTGNGSLN